MEANRIFKASLELLDMTSESGLVFVKDKDKASSSEIPVLELADKYNATAVYFRKFPTSNRPSLPQILIYDFTKESLVGESNLSEIHRRIWSNGSIPLIFVFTHTEIKVFNALCPPAMSENGKDLIESTLDKIPLISEASEKIKDFSAKLFDNGTFWECSKHRENFNKSESVYEKLLLQLKKFRSSLIQKYPDDVKIINKLLVLSIFVKYLEERKGKDGDAVFPSEFFKKYGNANSFVDVLKTKELCVSLLNDLSRHFNGKIFELTDAEKDQIVQFDLSPLADLVEGNIEGTQYTLWRLYSFKDLPIELISNIYEEFLSNSKSLKELEGVVYTPPHLVQFLIDESMPLDTPKQSFKVLDPACGSGIFLVAAFKRIVQWWRSMNNWATPDLETLKQLLTENIYGIDTQEEAIRVASFSISLTLCDMLSPKVIWNKLKFPNLKQNNLITVDFFSYILTNKNKTTFDLVIGNPPFIRGKNKWSKSALVLDKERTKNHPDSNIPEKQLALLFIDQATKITKGNGLICLIVPTGTLLYNNRSTGFRKFLLDNNSILQIVDFTLISRFLFGKRGDIPTAAIFVCTNAKPTSDLMHIVIKKSKAVKEKLHFELDPYDLHFVSYKEAISNIYIWKLNLFGGGRLKYFLQRFRRLPTLKDYLEKRQKHGWVYSEGIRSGNISDNRSNANSINLRGMLNLETKSFSDAGIDWQHLETIKESKYVSGNKGRVFKAPVLVIKELISKNNEIVSHLSDRDVYFKERIVGIHAPIEHKGELKEIQRKIKSFPVYSLYIALTSGEYLLNKSTAILKADLDSLPWVEDDADLQLNAIEQVLYDDISNYALDYRRSKKLSTPLLEPVTDSHIQSYFDTFSLIIGSLFQRKKISFSFSYHKGISFSCLEIFLGDVLHEIKVHKINDIETHLKSLLKTNKGALRITRIMKIYDKNRIVLIKPNELRFWLRTIAIRDADETFSDLVKQELIK